MADILTPDENVLKYAWYFPDGGPIPERYYNINQIVELLRENKNNPDTVQYIADMLEI